MNLPHLYKISGFIDNGIGKQKWVISKIDMFTCGIPGIMARLDKDEIREMLDSEEKKKRPLC